MNPVAHLGSRPFGIGRLRSAAPLGWAGLVLWVWATAALPAVHAARHAEESERGRTGHASHRQRILALVDEVLGRPPALGTPRHAHRHDHGNPGAPHGKGSIEHADLAFAAVPVFVVPAGFRVFETAELAPAPPSPTLAPLRRPGHPRGPPPLLLADQLFS